MIRSCHWALAIGALSLTLGCKKLGGDSGSSGAGTSGAIGQSAAAGFDVPFKGTFTRYAVTTFKNGRRVQSSNNAGSSTLTVEAGRITWAQTYPSSGKDAHVSQVYTFEASDMKPVESGYDVKLKWQKMDSDTTNYFPDKKNPILMARKQAGGWQMGLTTTDDNGVMGGVEFK